MSPDGDSVQRWKSASVNRPGYSYWVNSVPAQPFPPAIPAMWLTTASAITSTPAA